MNFINNLKFAWKYAKDNKKNLKIVLVLNFIRIILSVLNPILGAKIIVALTANEYYQILFIALLIFMTDSIINIFYYITRNIENSVYRSALTNLGVELGSNILKLENSCLDEKGSGLFIQRLTNDTSKIADAFSYLLNETTQFINYIGILIAMFFINKYVFLFEIIVLIILYTLENIRTKKRSNDDKIARKSTEKVTSFVNELVRGSRDIKMLNSENNFIDELEKRVVDANGKKLALDKRSMNYKVTIWEISTTFDFILCFILAFMINNSIILPAVAIILYNYYSNLYNSTYLIGEFLEYIKDFNVSVERVRDIIYSDDFKKEKFGNVHINKINGDFEFKNVIFGYKDKKVLNDISFKINANETVAFVGKSGVGKSTIFSLLCKMYDIESGSITIDGIDINDLDKNSIRGNITIISQNPYIFNMSIRDNLRLVKKDITDEEMKRACKIASLDEFINELPNGYDTLIGEGGVNLSGGQKQRLAIARALVQKTEIILFDEATSALDNETQAHIQKAIENMKGKYTILIIAHRLSTIKNSNRIIYIDNGKVVSEGNHKYLLKNCNKYRKLYETELNDDELLIS